MTAIPALVPTDRLHSANARLQGSIAFTYVIGTMTAGAVSAGADACKLTFEVTAREA
jgi:hypothetical protein